MNKKRILALIAVLVLGMALVVAGCGEKNEPSPTAVATPAQTVKPLESVMPSILPSTSPTVSTSPSSTPGAIETPTDSALTSPKAD